MQAASRLPAPDPRGQTSVLALGLALFVHVLLVAALTWGVSWNRTDRSQAVEAELWSQVPQEAAPPVVETPASPEPPPPPEKAEVPHTNDAEIALARERERQLKAAELERQRLRLEREKQEKAEHEKAEKEKAAKAEKDRQERLQRERDAAEARKKDLAEAAVRDKLRQENLKRMAGLAGGTGAPSSTGTAARSSGPSSSYGGRIKARVKPNIVFADEVTGNPEAEVEVRTAPDGTIVGRRLTKSSGVAAWDQAVLKAIDKTEILPRDVDGTVPPTLTLIFHPKD